MNLLKLASAFEKLAISSSEELASYNLLLNIYMQAQDIALLMSKTQFSDQIKATMIKIQKAAFNLANMAYNSGLSKSSAVNLFGEIKNLIGTIKPQLTQNVFKPFDKLVEMVNKYIPRELSVQSKNNATSPPAMTQATVMPSTGNLPQSIQIQMPG